MGGMPTSGGVRKAAFEEAEEEGASGRPRSLQNWRRRWGLCRFAGAAAGGAWWDPERCSSK
eukprot:7414981-Lingulodinium_polyedra.AAC.1